MFIIPNPRTSEAIEAIKVDPVNGTVITRFRVNGYEYKYSNVSRLAIINLLMQPNMSLGFWVQELANNAIRVRDYLYGNTVATGKLCYQFIGATCDSKAALPF